MTIEEALRELEGKAAMLRHLAASAALNDAIPEPAVWSVIEDVCDELGRLARGLKGALGVDALDRSLP